MFVPFGYIDRNGQSIMHAPSELVYASPNNDTRDTGTFGPLNDRHGDFIVGEKSVAQLVSALFFSCRPAAVAWIVTTIVVDAVNRVLGRWCDTHVLKKQIKRLAPAITDGYSATAIRLKSGVLGIVASLFHPLPRIVLFGAREAMRLSSVPDLLSDAAATLCASVSQVCPVCEHDISAITKALPKNRRSRSAVVRESPFKFRKHCKPSVSLSCTILKTRHFISPCAVPGLL
jgi:hypothetical protein